MSYFCWNFFLTFKKKNIYICILCVHWAYSVFNLALKNHFLEHYFLSIKYLLSPIFFFADSECAHDRLPIFFSSFFLNGVFSLLSVYFKFKNSLFKTSLLEIICVTLIENLYFLISLYYEVLIGKKYFLKNKFSSSVYH